MNKFLKILAILLIFTSYSNAQKSALEQSGDIVQILIPLGAYTSTFIMDDKQGRYQFYKSLLSTTVVTHALKRIILRQRPDNSNNHSFPSGHTSAAFQGASFVHLRYGTSYSIIPYLAASYVGHTRIKANKHYTIDVIAGALIGIFSNYYFATKYHKNVLKIKPTLVSSNTYGLQLKYSW